MKDFLKKCLRILFNVLQKVGINFLPKHYYSNIPDFGLLKDKDFWKKPLEMIGINGTNLEEQINFVNSCVSPVEDKSVLTGGAVLKQAVKDEGKLGFGTVEADQLYSFIYSYKPKKVIQIGCGVSTSVILQAAEKANYKVEIVCVEPYPSAYLNKMEKEGKITLIGEIAQTVEMNKLTNLEEGDLFFVDSTHTVKPGSEVNRIILDVLPRLKSNVYIHFHDIYFPYDYQRNIDSTLFFWEESTLLHSYLINNSKITILACLSMLHYGKKAELKNIFPVYNPESDKEGLPTNRELADRHFHFPASIYLKTQ